jgi:hypothetical protein
MTPQERLHALLERKRFLSDRDVSAYYNAGSGREL